MIAESARDIQAHIKGKVLYNEPMKKHTSFRVGGPADVWVAPDDAVDLRTCFMLAKDKNMPVYIAGGGTNLLVRDEGIKGMVISMTSPEMKKVYYGDKRAAVMPAMRLGEFIKSCAENNLGGLEFLAGVPGTVGGAVAMNSGARHYEKRNAWKGISEFVEEIKVMDYEGTADVLLKKDLYFGYKSSGIGRRVITEIKFLLNKEGKEGILGEYNNFLKTKKSAQDLRSPSAGCVFKNPAGYDMSAGEMIDKCGLKGRRAGGAVISEKHANFIINTGGAAAKDIMALIDIVRLEVRTKFGAALELEIEIV